MCSGQEPPKCIYSIPVQATAKHRAKFGWPLSDVAAVTKPKRETHWNLLGCPKLAIRSQPLVGRRSPYCKDIWRKYYHLTSFFSNCRYIPSLRRYSPTNLCDGAQMAIFGVIFASCISASRAQHVSDMHSKFALWPHHVWKYGRHPISDRWDRHGKRRRKKKKETTGRKYNLRICYAGRPWLYGTQCMTEPKRCYYSRRLPHFSYSRIRNRPNILRNRASE